MIGRDFISFTRTIAAGAVIYPTQALQWMRLSVENTFQEAVDQLDFCEV